VLGLFLFKDHLAQSFLEETIIFVGQKLKELDDAGNTRVVEEDDRIYGLRQKVKNVVPVSFLKKESASEALIRRVGSVVAIDWNTLNRKKCPLGLKRKSLPVADTTPVCDLCSHEVGRLYENICSCNKDINLCKQCSGSLSHDIVRDMRIECAGTKSGPAHIIFSLQTPRCPYCKSLYYSENETGNNFEMLAKAMPVEKRQAFVVSALTKALEKFSQEELVNLLNRLLATNVSYREIAVYKRDGTLLSCSDLALRLFEKDLAMREAIVEPFTNEIVWKR